MTPEILELAKVVGLPAAVLLYMWMNRTPAPKDQGDPERKVHERLDAIEARQERTESKVDILLDRTPRK